MEKRPLFTVMVRARNVKRVVEECLDSIVGRRLDEEGHDAIVA